MTSFVFTLSLNFSIRFDVRKAFCDTPNISLNAFCRRAGDAPVISESSATVSMPPIAIVSRTRPMKRAFTSAAILSLGRQRRHGRKPADSASATVEKNTTFSCFGIFDLHDGRQKMPVVFTAKKNTPSKFLSLDRSAFQRQFSDPLMLGSCDIFRV